MKREPLIRGWVAGHGSLIAAFLIYSCAIRNRMIIHLTKDGAGVHLAPEAAIVSAATNSSTASSEGPHDHHSRHVE